jgi:hypothetical protein
VNNANAIYNIISQYHISIKQTGQCNGGKWKMDTWWRCGAVEALVSKPTSLISEQMLTKKATVGEREK